MKISKHIHSCLLIEEQGKTILIDPGNYSYENHGLDISSLEKLDYILITHEHADHMYLPFIKELLQKFPQVKIFSNLSVKNILKKENITVSTEGNEIIKIEPVNHEQTFDKTPPQNVMFTIFNTLSDPGDSLSFTYSANILALPITAPWGSSVWAVNIALQLKPEIIIPVHDWHWRDESRKWLYDRLEKHFAQSGIAFKKLESGEIIEA